MVIKTICGSLKILGAISPRIAGSVAFYLFCRPTHRSRLRSWEEERMASARGSWLTVNAKRVTVYHWGDGTKPVLMLHGWSSRASRFAELASRLLELGYSPVAFDAPGHGESSGNKTSILEYEEICRQLAGKYGCFSAVVAHSFGVLCQFRALRSPVPAEKAVAISGVCDFDYLEEAFCEQLGVNEKVRENLRRRIEQLFLPVQGIWEQFSVTYEAEKLNIPILVIHDDGDHMVDISQAKKISEAYTPNARLVTTRRLGHHRIISDNEVIQGIIDFIERSEQATDKTVLGYRTN